MSDSTTDSLTDLGTQEDSQAVQARQKKQLQWSWLAWILPVLALAMTAWLVYTAIPTISASLVVRTENANGIQANSTLVYYRGVAIGIVKRVDLLEDLTGVNLTIDIEDGHQGFARSGAKFWVIRPELDNIGLQGLTTIVSGPEIHALPGSGDLQSEFLMEKQIPLAGVSSDDLEIQLTAALRSGISRGTKVSYRGVNTGVVTGTRLAPDSRAILIAVNIYADFQHLIRKNTVFWNSGGLDIDFSLFSGADIRASSLPSFFAGEISFATPNEPGLLTDPGDFFVLQEDADKDWLNWQPLLEKPITATPTSTEPEGNQLSN